MEGAALSPLSEIRAQWEGRALFLERARACIHKETGGETTGPSVVSYASTEAGRQFQPLPFTHWSLFLEPHLLTYIAVFFFKKR